MHGSSRQGNWAIATLAGLAACSHLPPLTEANQNRLATAALCRQAFPPQPWRATHTLFATLPLGYNGALIGVTVADAEGLHAMLLSPEGVTVFDAVEKVGRDGRASKLTIRRAVPPLDRPAFAAALMADVGNAFLPPPAQPTLVGTSATGRTVCRWSPLNGDATEVELGAAGPARIRTYRGARLSRDIALRGAPDHGFFPEVDLSVPGAGGYRLELRLVDHE